LRLPYVVSIDFWQYKVEVEVEVWSGFVFPRRQWLKGTLLSPDHVTHKKGKNRKPRFLKGYQNLSCGTFTRLLSIMVIPLKRVIYLLIWEKQCNFN